MKYVPMPWLIFVEPNRRVESQTKSGLLIAKPKTEGEPNIGTIHSVGRDIEEERLKPGVMIVFNEPSPSGFKVPNRDGRKRGQVPVFAIKEEQVEAIIEQS